MNVSLTPALERLVKEKIKSGMYHSNSEVVREALRLLKQRDEVRRHDLAELRAKVAVGLEQLERGEGIPGDVAWKMLKERHRRRNRKNGRV